MLPVLQHALDALDPRWLAVRPAVAARPDEPGRLPADVSRRASSSLRRAPGRQTGSWPSREPPFNPIWHAVIDRDGYLEPLAARGPDIGRRQDVPRVLRINAALYLFRSSFLRQETKTWLNGRHLLLEIPELRAFHIDSTEDDFRLCELVLERGLVQLPWLES